MPARVNPLVRIHLNVYFSSKFLRVNLLFLLPTFLMLKYMKYRLLYSKTVGNFFFFYLCVFLF